MIPRSASQAAGEAGGVGLVGQADLDMLDIACDPRIGELRPLGPRRRREPRTSARSAIPTAASRDCHRLGQAGDVGLLGVGPAGDRDEVDLATVEPAGHHLGLEAHRSEAPDRQLGRAVERAVLLRAGGPPVREHRSVPRTPRRSRSPGCSTETAVPGPFGSRPELAVDVLHVGTAHDEHVHSGARSTTPCAPRSAVASARRSGTAVPSQSKISASNRLVGDHDGITLRSRSHPYRRRHEDGPTGANGPGRRGRRPHGATESVSPEGNRTRCRPHFLYAPAGDISLDIRGQSRDIGYCRRRHHARRRVDVRHIESHR